MSYDVDNNRTDAPHVYGESDLTYNDYLKVDALLSLQIQQSDPPHHDEMLFIIIHQTYELWFKLMLHELETSGRFMARQEVLRARHFVHRVVEILRVLVGQIHILVTMTPAEFLKFRDRLMPASGVQSVQFRELEYLLGLKDPKYLRFFKSCPALQQKLQQRLDAPDLRVVFYDLLRGLGMDIPEALTPVGREPTDAEREKILSALNGIYSNPTGDLPLYLLCESLVDLDEQLSLWREHHVRVVERIIGSKMGTGGSSGADYLRSTTIKRCFPFLWEVRTYLTR